MQNVNQFSQSIEKGLIDTKIGSLILSCKVSGAALVPGQAVKLVDGTSGVPEVAGISAQADDVFGVVIRDYKTSSHAVGSMVEIAVSEAIVHLEASEAIARGAEVSVLATGLKVESAEATERVIGRALDKATANGNLIRVLVKCPGYIKA